MFAGSTAESADSPMCSTSPRRSEPEKLFPPPRSSTLKIISDSKGGSRHAQKMHSALTRANALCAYTMSVLASLTFLCFLSTFFNEYQVKKFFFFGIFFNAQTKSQTNTIKSKCSCKPVGLLVLVVNIGQRCGFVFIFLLKSILNCGSKYIY